MYLRYFYKFHFPIFFRDRVSLCKSVGCLKLTEIYLQGAEIKGIYAHNLKIFLKIYFILFMCRVLLKFLWICIYISMEGAGQKRVSGPFQLELQIILSHQMWVQGTNWVLLFACLFDEWFSKIFLTLYPTAWSQLLKLNFPNKGKQMTIPYIYFLRTYDLHFYSFYLFDWLQIIRHSAKYTGWEVNYKMALNNGLDTK